MTVNSIDLESLACNAALAGGASDGPLHESRTFKCFGVPRQGSPKRSLPEAIVQDDWPTQAASMIDVVFSALHEPRVKFELHEPLEFPYDAKTTPVILLGKQDKVAIPPSPMFSEQ
jgi:hypothetical protein